MRKALFKAKMTSILDVNKIWNLRKLYGRFIGFFFTLSFWCYFFLNEISFQNHYSRIYVYLKEEVSITIFSGVALILRNKIGYC